MENKNRLGEDNDDESPGLWKLKLVIVSMIRNKRKACFVLVAD